MEFHTLKETASLRRETSRYALIFLIQFYSWAKPSFKPPAGKN